MLAKYVWNAGGSWQDRPWTKDQPCDAHVVMHVFRSFMDEILVGEDPDVNHGLPFTNVYFSFSRTDLGERIPDAKIFPQNAANHISPHSFPAPLVPPTSRTSFLIRKVTQYPPHFNLVVDKTTWAILPVRTLLFLDNLPRSPYFVFIYDNQLLGSQQHVLCHCPLPVLCQDSGV